MARAESAVQSRCVQLAKPSNSRDAEWRYGRERRPDFRAEVLPEQYSGCALLSARAEVRVLIFSSHGSERLSAWEPFLSDVNLYVNLFFRAEQKYALVEVFCNLSSFCRLAFVLNAR